MSLSEAQINAILDSPALEPPEGVTANFDNPENNNSLAWAVNTTCTVLATIFLLLRLYAKHKQNGWRLKAEEILMICSYGAYWGTNYAAYAMIYTPGYYVHQWDLHNRDLVQPLYLILIYGCCYSAVLPLLKTAILIDWCRIFVPGRTRDFFWMGAVFLMAIQCLWGFLCILLLNLQCRPHNAIWQFWVPSKCYSLPKVMLTSASTQVATDILMMLLPQKMIWNLHLNWQRKVGVSIIFGVGAIGVVSACFRLSKTISFAQTTDSMYFIGPLLFWADGEMTCAFFILSITCLPRLISESHLPSRFKAALGISSHNSRSNGATGGAVSSTNPSKRTHGDKGTPLVTIGGSNTTHGGHGDEAYYYKMEESIDMDTNSRLAHSESQEQLHFDRKNGGVVRTTEVTITTDVHSSSDGSTTVPVKRWNESR